MLFLDLLLISLLKLPGNVMFIKLCSLRDSSIRYASILLIDIIDRPAIDLVSQCYLLGVILNFTRCNIHGTVKGFFQRYFKEFSF